MKVFTTAFAAMLAAMAIWAQAAPLPLSVALSTDLHSPLSADDDKDKETDKKGD